MGHGATTPVCPSPASCSQFSAHTAVSLYFRCPHALHVHCLYACPHTVPITTAKPESDLTVLPHTDTLRNNLTVIIILAKSCSVFGKLDKLTNCAQHAEQHHRTYRVCLTSFLRGESIHLPISLKPQHSRGPFEVRMA